MLSLIDKIRVSLIGYRKMLVILLVFSTTCILLVLGYDVAKMDWLGIPIASFVGANIIEHVPAILEKANNIKRLNKEHGGSNVN